MRQVLYKKFYTIKDFYQAFSKGLYTLKFLRKAKKNQTLSADFIRRIMLAVTEVNGCEVCSYAHTKAALEQGMDESEVKNILFGDITDLPTEEVPAILFAQHYADTKGRPSKAAWKKVVATYGEETALGILGAIRMIMVGNIYGIPLSAFKSRLKGKKVRQVTFWYEIKMLSSILYVLPAALVHQILLKLTKAPVITFQEEKLQLD